MVVKWFYKVFPKNQKIFKPAPESDDAAKSDSLHGRRCGGYFPRATADTALTLATSRNMPTQADNRKTEREPIGGGGGKGFERGWVSYNASPSPSPPLRTDLAHREVASASSLVSHPHPHPRTENFTASVARTDLARKEVAIASSLVSRRGAKYTRRQKKLKKVLRFFD